MLFLRKFSKYDMFFDPQAYKHILYLLTYLKTLAHHIRDFFREWGMDSVNCTDGHLKNVCNFLMTDL